MQTSRGYSEVADPYDPNKTRILHRCWRVQDTELDGFYKRIQFFSADEWCLLIKGESIEDDDAVYIPIECCPFCGVNLNSLFLED